VTLSEICTFPKVCVQNSGKITSLDIWSLFELLFTMAEPFFKRFIHFFPFNKQVL